MGNFKIGCTIKNTKGSLKKEYRFEKHSVQTRIYKNKLYVFSKRNDSSIWTLEDIVKIQNISKKYFPSMQEIRLGLQRSQKESKKLYASVNIIYEKYHMDSIKTKLEWLIILSMCF